MISESLVQTNHTYQTIPYTLLTKHLIDINIYHYYYHHYLLLLFNKMTTFPFLIFC